VARCVLSPTAATGQISSGSISFKHIEITWIALGKLLRARHRYIAISESKTSICRKFSLRNKWPGSNTRQSPRHNGAFCYANRIQKKTCLRAAYSSRSISELMYLPPPLSPEEKRQKAWWTSSIKHNTFKANVQMEVKLHIFTSALDLWRSSFEALVVSSLVPTGQELWRSTLLQLITRTLQINMAVCWFLFCKQLTGLHQVGSSRNAFLLSILKPGGTGHNSEAKECMR
jgi:hypothetical protein